MASGYGRGEPRLLQLHWDSSSGRVLPEAALLDVAVHLRGGGLVSMPTETVYGFGCVCEPRPVQELQRLKGRGAEKPFLLLIPGPDDVQGLEWTSEALELARVFWPGALTLILRDPQGRFPVGIRSQEGAVAVRVTPNPLAMGVVESVKEPLVSTSANLPGGPPALSAEGAFQAARSLGAGDRMWILDGGPLAPSDPSTIIDCTGKIPVVRRMGSVPMQRLRRVLPEIHEPI